MYLRCWASQNTDPDWVLEILAISSLLHSLVRYRVETREKKIPYLQATMYYFVFYINILLTGRSERFKKRNRCYSLMARNSVSDMSAADWLFQTHVKNYRSFPRVVIGFLSAVEIPIKLSSLYHIRL